MDRNQSKNLFLFIGCLSAGVVTGWLLISRSDRKNILKIRENYRKAGKWFGGQNRKVINHGKKSVSAFTEYIRNSFEKSIPDLYDATEEISIEDTGTVNTSHA
ncbi:MAG: hypothetical protein WD035_11775 [Balneolaceae bacterium]